MRKSISVAEAPRCVVLCHDSRKRLIRAPRGGYLASPQRLVIFVSVHYKYSVIPKCKTLGLWGRGGAVPGEKELTVWGVREGSSKER